MRTTANEQFGKTSNTAKFYHHRLTTLMYTEGIKEMVAACKATWLLHLILQLTDEYDTTIHKRTIWEVMRLREDEFYVFVIDDKGHRLAGKHIKKVILLMMKQPSGLSIISWCFHIQCKILIHHLKIKDMRTNANDFFGSKTGNRFILPLPTFKNVVHRWRKSASWSICW